MQDIMLNVTFYDNQGNLTGSIISAPFFSHLRPGEKSAFDIVAQGDAAYRLMDFSYYKISRTWERAAESKETLMRMDIRDITLDPCGYYTIEGLVTNLAREHTAGIEIAAAQRIAKVIERFAGILDRSGVLMPELVAVGREPRR